MDRITRKELKTDKFAAEVGQTVQFLERHRRESIVAGVAIVIVALAAIGFYYRGARQHEARQALLHEMTRAYTGTVGPENPFSLSFPTEEAKREAVDQKIQELIDRYPRSDEAMVARTYRGIMAAARRQLEEAEADLKHVVDSGNDELASQAALPLATVYAETGRLEDGERLLRNLIENPTYLVSKEQATIALADLLMTARPEEARQLLEPLRGERPAVSRSALTMLGQLDAAQNQ